MTALNGKHRFRPATRALLAVAWRDVIVAGEREQRGMNPVQVRDLIQPLEL